MSRVDPGPAAAAIRGVARGGGSCTAGEAGGGTTLAAAAGSGSAGLDLLRDGGRRLGAVGEGISGADAARGGVWTSRVEAGLAAADLRRTAGAGGSGATSALFAQTANAGG
ncbi:MAG TPA: hypothetical protein VGS10_02455 [Terracidiphilus sp.]|nr:hypothetical protein [Terracidiphilus sp.]